MTKIFYVKSTWSDEPVPQMFGVAADTKSDASLVLRNRLREDCRALVDITHSKNKPIPRSQHEWEYGTTLWYGDANKHE